MLKQRFAEMEAKINCRAKTVAKLLSKNEESRRRLGMNINNSHKPSSINEYSNEQLQHLFVHSAGEADQ